MVRPVYLQEMVDSTSHHFPVLRSLQEPFPTDNAENVGSFDYQADEGEGATSVTNQSLAARCSSRCWTGTGNKGGAGAASCARTLPGMPDDARRWAVGSSCRNHRDPLGPIACSRVVKARRCAMQP